MSWREKRSLRLSTDSESEYDLSLRQSTPARGRAWSKRSRFGKVAARLAATALVGLVIYLSTTADKTDPEVLAKGIEQCEYIRSRPGPPADFHTRRFSDRFEEGTKPVLIRNATMWTGGKGGEEIVHGDILMDGGVIRKVGDVSLDLLNELKGNLHEIDAHGAWVTPGLVDGHSHGEFGQMGSGTDGANSVQGDIHPYVRVLDVFDTHAPDTKLIIAGGVTTQLVLPGSAVGIGGQAYVAKYRSTSANSASSWLVEPPFDFGHNMTAKRIPQHWRHMKHALGENPNGVFNIVRMDNIWNMRKAYKEAQDWKKKQGGWCAAAESASGWPFGKDLGPFPEAPLEVESLVDVLNGKVKLNCHSYEVTDFDALVRMSNEFGIEVAGIHHAHEAWLVPDMLKKMYKNPPAVAIFATFSMYKTESYRSSFYAPKILTEAGLDVVMKSDHNGVVARWLMQEAAIAHHWGLDEAAAMNAVTTNPAKLIGMDHRVGYLRPGYDADVVIWQSHPLAVGAAPSQVFIDGIPQLDKPILKARPESAQRAPPSGKFDAEAAYDVATKGEPDYAPKARYEDVVFTNAKSVVARKSGGLEELVSAKDAARGADVVVKKGKIVCVGRCSYASKDVAVIDLQGGSIVPGLTAAGTDIGLLDVDLPISGGQGAPVDTLTSKPAPLLEYSVQKSADGAIFGGKKSWRFIQSGFTHSMPIPRSDGLVKGVSSLIRLGAKHPLDGAILNEANALNVVITGANDDPYPSVASQLGALRDLLLGDITDAEGTAIEEWSYAAAHGEVPLIVQVHQAEHMARLISIKKEVERHVGRGKLNMVFQGGSESHLLADEIAKAGISVIVAHPRSFPYTQDERRSLPGVPLSNETAISTLLKAGVTLGVGMQGGTPPFQSAAFAFRWTLANIMADTTADIDRMDVLAMATTNLDKIYGVKRNVAEALENDFVAYQGGDILDFGGSKVVAFSSPGAVEVF